MMQSQIDCMQPPSIRVYHWSEPAVSIGWLQDWSLAADQFPGATMVRRPTGGRAVQHGNDLTIAVAVRAEYLPGRTNNGVLGSYFLIMSGLIDALEHFDVITATGSERIGERNEDCFASVGKCDLVDTRTGKKIAGSAQRRSHGTILQQISLPFDDRWKSREERFLEILRQSLSSKLGISEHRYDDEVANEEWKWIGRKSQHAHR